MNYKIVHKRRAIGHDDFVEQCNQVIREGFSPLGGLSLIRRDDSQVPDMYQAFYKAINSHAFGSNKAESSSAFVQLSEHASARLSEVIRALSILRRLGEYDTTIAGAVGEIYAQVELEMKKAQRGQKGFDGTINGRTVSVKTKESNKPGRYVTVDPLHRHHVQDLLIVIMRTDGLFEHYGPVPFIDIEHLFNKKHQVSISALKRKHRLEPTISEVRWREEE